MKTVPKELISVIIPVYNAAPWLSEALDSLKVQTYPDFEVIMIDDGSTDNSSEICRRYSDSDSRFRIISQPNSGVSNARNRGVDESVGEWICFMDADDIMPCYALEALIKSAIGSNTKIAIGDYLRSNRALFDKSLTAAEPLPMTVMDSEDAIVTGLYQKRILNNPWGALFHASIFKEKPTLRFRDCRYEDLDLFYRAFERTDRICLLDLMVYVYRDNPASFINTWSRGRLDALDVTDRIVSHTLGKSLRLRRAARDRRFSAHFNILLLMLRHGIDLPLQKERCLKVIREDRLGELRDSNVRIKNKLGALLSYLGLPAMKLLCKLSH